MLIATNPNGSTIVTVMGDGNIHVSHDYGATWLMDAAMHSNWGSLSVSDNGQKILAADGSTVYLSINGGVDWDDGFEVEAQSVKISGDGTRGAILGPTTYLSSDGCVTWNVVENVAFVIDASPSLDALLGINPPTGPEGLRVMISDDFGLTWVDNGPYSNQNQPQTLMTEKFIRFLNYSAEIFELEYEHLTTEFGFDGEALITGFLELETRTQTVLGDWVQIPAVTKIQGTGVIASSDGQIVIMSGYDGILRSTNGGASFTKVFNEDIHALSASDDLSVIMGIHDVNPIVSIDSGLTWILKDNFSFSSSECMVSFDGTKLYANDGEDIAVSEDFGDTWELVISVVGLNWWAASKDFSVVYTQSNNDPIMKSIDSGATFNSIPSPFGSNWFKVSDDGATIITNTSLGDDTLGISSDFGETWKTKPSGLNGGYNEFFVSDDGNTVGFTEGSGIFLSTDFGVNWIERSITTWGDNVTIRGNTIYAPCSVSLYKSEDLGATFKASNISGFQSFKLLDDGTAIAGVNEHILKSNKPYAWWDFKTSIGGDMNEALLSSSKDGSKIVAAHNDFGPINISIDSGDTWSALPYDGGPRGDWYSIASSADGAKLYAVDDNWSRVYRSNDSGATWTLLDVNGDGVAASSDGTKVVTVSDTYVYYSTDSGNTWSQIYSTTISIYSLVISGDGTKIAIADGEGNVHVSTDSGVTWNSVFVVDNWDNKLAMTGDGVHLALSNYNGNIWTSTDSGVTWLESTAPVGSWRDIKYSADGSNLVAIYAFEWPTGTLWTSADHGVTWIQQTGLDAHDTSRLAVSADGQTIAVLGNYSSHISISVNGGVNWTNRLAIPLNISALTLSQDSSNLIVGTNNSYIYTSDDLGLTFEADESENYREWNALVMSGDGSVTYATDEQNFFKSIDDGQSWTSIAIPELFYGSSSLIGTSYDGSRVYIALMGVGLLASDDYGATFDLIFEWFDYWYSLSVSDDGANIVLVGENGSMFRSDDYGVTWVKPTGSISAAWFTITSNDDGTKLFAGVDDGKIWTSSDFGITWIATSAPNKQWRSIVVSDDGNKLAAITSDEPGSIFTSSDSGVTWVERTSAGSRDWLSIATSADGTKLAAVVFNGYIYTSTDSGVTWTEQTGSDSRSWVSIASSADGTKLVACNEGEYVYTSDDSGVTWVQQIGSGTGSRTNLVSSSDGVHLAVLTGYIDVSNDGGETWFSKATLRSWMGLASSSDGSKLLAADDQYLYISNDYGESWAQCDTPSQGWYSVTSSNDGSKLAAVVFNGRIWTSIDSGVTWSDNTPSETWTSADLSADGQTIVAFDTANNNALKISHDFGETWVPGTTELPDDDATVRISPNGKIAFALFYNDEFFYTEETDLYGLSFDTQASVTGYANIVSSSEIDFVVTDAEINALGDLIGETSLTFTAVMEMASAKAEFFFDTFGTLTGTAVLEAEILFQFGEFATLTGSANVVAQSALTISTQATMRGSALVVGASSVSFVPTALAQGFAVITSTQPVGLSFGTYGVQTGTGSLAATTFPDFFVNGTMTGAGVVVGSSILTFSHLANLQIYVPIAGTLNVAFGDDAFLSANMAGSGSSSMTFALPDAKIDGFAAAISNVLLSFDGEGTMAGVGNGSGVSVFMFDADAIPSATADLQAEQIHLTFGEDAFLGGFTAGSGSTSLNFNAGEATIDGFAAAIANILLKFDSEGTLVGAGHAFGSTELIFNNVAIPSATGSLFVEEIQLTFESDATMFGVAALETNTEFTFGSGASIFAYAAISGESGITFYPTADIIYFRFVYGTGIATLGFDSDAALRTATKTTPVTAFDVTWNTEVSFTSYITGDDLLAEMDDKTEIRTVLRG